MTKNYNKLKSSSTKHYPTKMYDSISVFNTCTDINECSTNTHGCQNGATCLNTDGSYTCTCVMGWTGDMCDTGGLALSTLNLCYIVFIVAFVICLCFSLQLILIKEFHCFSTLFEEMRLQFILYTAHTFYWNNVDSCNHVYLSPILVQ